MDLQAWLDRSARNDYRDGPDLALCASWYMRSDQIIDRLYAEPSGSNALEHYGWDQDLAATATLADDLVAHLSESNALMLKESCRGRNPALLGKYLDPGLNVPWPQDKERREAIAVAFLERVQRG